MARPKVLVFQHVPYEPLGTLDPLLKEAGFRLRYINFGREPGQRPTLEPMPSSSRRTVRTPSPSTTMANCSRSRPTPYGMD